MDEIPTYTKLIDGVLAILAALVIWFSKRSVKQFDDRIGSLERTSVNVDSLTQFRAQLATEHVENGKKLDRIEGRVDDLFQFFAERK